MIKILHILLLVLFMSYNGHAQEGFSKEDIEDIIYEYIMENPEIILESVDNLRKKMEASSVESDNFLKNEFDTFANDNNIPNFGDPNANCCELFEKNCPCHGSRTPRLMRATAHARHGSRTPKGPKGPHGAPWISRP